MPNFTWNLNTGGSWIVPRNWAPVGLPGDTSAVTIATIAPATITFPVLAPDLTLDIVTVNSLSLGALDTLSVAGQLTVNSASTLSGTVSLAGGDLSLDGATTIGALSQFYIYSGLAGLLSGSGVVTVTGAATIGTGGVDQYQAEAGTGTTDLEGTTTITASLYLYGGRVLQNDGTLNWSSPADGTPSKIVVGNLEAPDSLGATLNNSAGAVFNLQSDGLEFYDIGGPGTFNNAGLLVKAGGGGEDDIEIPISNTGSIHILSGTLALDDGGSSAASGLSVSSGATLQFGNADDVSFVLGAGTIGGDGDVSLMGGILDASGSDNFFGIGSAAASRTLSLYAGTLSLGAAPLTVGTFFQGGNASLSGTGVFTVTGAATIAGDNFGDGAETEDGAGTTDLEGTTTVNDRLTLDDGRLLQNDGTLNVSAGISIIFENYSTLNNRAGAVFELQGDNSIISNLISVAPAGEYYFINNIGTLVVAAGTGIDRIDASYLGQNTDLDEIIDNTGAIIVNSGTLDIIGILTGSGVSVINNAATLELQGPTQQTVQFNSAQGELKLFPAIVTSNDGMVQFSGDITGLTVGDRIDLPEVPFPEVVSASVVNGSLLEVVVDILDGAETPIIYTFNVQGSLAGAQFVASNDGFGYYGGTLLTLTKSTGGNRGTIGGGQGDVHMTSFDGLNFDFQAEGEFTLAKSTLAGDSFDLQARMLPFTNSASVSVMTEIAASVGTDRVTFDVNRSETVWVDGRASSLSAANPVLALNGGILKELAAGHFQIVWNTGEVANITDVGGFLDFTAQLSTSDGPGSVEGLLGSASGQANDFQLANGTVLAQPLSSAELYGEFASAWSVRQATSLLDYAPGQTTATFTDVHFPSDAVTLAALPQHVFAAAAAAVAAANITNPIEAAAAELDYAETGDPSFIDAAANAAQTLAPTEAASVTPSEQPTGALGVIADQAMVKEASSRTTSVTFDVYLTAALATDTTVTYAVIAPNAADLNAASFGGVFPSGQVEIAAGQTTGQFTLTLPANVLGALPQQSLVVEIAGPGGTPVFASTAQAAIINPSPVAGTQAVPVFADISPAGTLTRTGPNAYQLDLGIQHVGDVGAQAELSLINNAAAPADDLGGTISVSGGSGFNVGGTGALTSIGAGDSYGGLAVAVDTSASGDHAETIALAATDSNGSGYSAALAPVTVALTNVVDNYAVAALEEVSGGGAWTQSGNNYTLDLGTVSGGSKSIRLGLLNGATGLADLLSANVTVTGDSAFANSGFANVSGLGAGQADTSPTVTLNTGTAGTFSETITVNAKGSNASGYSAALAPVTLTITGTVAAAIGTTYVLTKGVDTLNGGSGDNTVIAANATLGPGDQISAGSGYNKLELQGGGVFNLAAPTTLSGLSEVDVQEGQAAGGGDPATRQSVYLRNDQDVTVNVASGVAAAGDTSLVGISLYGANDSDTINLGSGADTVFVGSTNETVNGGGGNDTFFETAATVGATINGGTGINTLYLTRGGSLALGANVTGISEVVLQAPAAGQIQPAWNFTANAISGLKIVDVSGTADTITLGGSGQSVFTAGSTDRILAGAAEVGDMVQGISSQKIDTLEITEGGTFALNPLTFNVDVDLDQASALTLNNNTLGVTGSSGGDTLVIESGDLRAMSTINLTGGNNILALEGAGSFNLATPATLSGITTITAEEGQISYSGNTPVFYQRLFLRDGMDATINVASDTNLLAGDPNAPNIYIHGADNADVINLGSGDDYVWVGSSAETVNGGGGTNNLYETAATIGATINGGTGTSTLFLQGGGTASLGSNVTGISQVVLQGAAQGPFQSPWTFTSNAISGLTIVDESGAAGTDTLTAGGTNQTLIGGSANDILDGGLGGATLTGGTGTTLFRFDSISSGADTISNYGSGQDHIGLSASGFGLSSLSQISFEFGTSLNPAAGRANVLYNTATGALYYDAVGGDGHIVQIATLTNHPTLSSSDFVLL